MDPLLRCLEGYAQMHIAMIAPPWFPIPPQARWNRASRLQPGRGTRRSRSPGDTLRPGSARKPAPRSSRYRKSPTAWTWTKRKTTISETTCRRAFSLATSIGADIIHDHTDYIYRRNSPIPIVRTIHGPVTDCVLDRYQAMTRQGDQFIAISRRQMELFDQPRLTVSEPVERSYSRPSSTT